MPSNKRKKQIDEDNEEDANSQKRNEEEAAADDDDDSVEVVEVVVPTVLVYSVNPESVARRECRLRVAAAKKAEAEAIAKKSSRKRYDY